MAHSTIKRRWRICGDCFKAFVAQKGRCPACDSQNHSGVECQLSQAEIEESKTEVLDAHDRRMRT